MICEFPNYIGAIIAANDFIERAGFLQPSGRPKKNQKVKKPTSATLLAVKQAAEKFANAARIRVRKTTDEPAGDIEIVIDAQVASGSADNPRPGPSRRRSTPISATSSSESYTDDPDNHGERIRKSRLRHRRQREEKERKKASSTTSGAVQQPNVEIDLFDDQGDQPDLEIDAVVDQGDQPGVEVDVVVDQPDVPDPNAIFVRNPAQITENVNFGNFIHFLYNFILFFHTIFINYLSSIDRNSSKHWKMSTIDRINRFTSMP